jgi:alkylation response protein AidB-like acyl-CoA dehydrogenase
MIVTAATAVKSDGKKRFSNFIVRKSDPGVSIGKKFDKLGMRSSPTSEIFFEDVFVPDQNLLGDEGKGIRQALTILDVDRILASCLAIGIIDRVLTDSINYSKTREQFDQPISNFQAIQFKLADMECDLRASRALLASVLQKEEDPTEFMMEVAALKLFSTSAAMKHTLEAIQIFGGYGYMKEYPPERFMRDNKMLEIAGGSSEILRIVLSREILK